MQFKQVLSCFVSVILALLLTTNTFVVEAVAAPPALRIVIVEGQGAVNNLKQRTAREPVVEIRDENNRPVAGATVVFLLPDKGAGGVFADGSTRFQTLTDQSGRAAARGIAPNNVAGSFRISIEASYLGKTATASILQSNVAGAAAGMSGKLLALLAVGGGVAAGAAVALSHGGGKSPTTLPTVQSGTSIVAGRPTVGGPQ